jgi:hypothetical protein
MIDQWSEDRTGWARFSDDMTMRYRLGRSLHPGHGLVVGAELTLDGRLVQRIKRLVFLMINPSDADAFEPDPTITECRKRSVALGADVLEVVNLFAWRSPYPTDLKKRAHGFRGDDAVNNQQIMGACSGASMVIAAWGNDGGLDYRDLSVLNLLRGAGVKLHHLGTTQDGYPKHPLARGKHRIPADQQPIPWSF